MGSRIWDGDSNKVHIFTAGTFGRVIAKRKLNAPKPAFEFAFGFGDVFWDEEGKLAGIGVIFGVDAVVAEHIEVFFRDMYDQALDEIKSGDCFDDTLVILVPLVPESDGRPIVAKDPRLRHGRPANVAGNIVGYVFGRVEIGAGGMDIKAIAIAVVKVIFERAEALCPKLFFQEAKQSGLPLFAQHGKRDVVKILPSLAVAASAFGKQDMYMGVPLEVTAESVQAAEDARGELLRLAP